MPKKSPLDATIEELDQIARKAFAEHAADMASGKVTGVTEDYEVGVPSRVLKLVMEKLKQEDSTGTSAGEKNDTSARHASEKANSWDEFFSQLENTEDFLLDRDQGEK